jgi:hypothetical protein
MGSVVLPLPVLGVFSSALLPGFSGPESSVLLVDLPPSVPSPLWCIPLRFGFLAPSSDPRRQDRRASLGKAYDLPTCRPATHRFDTPDIGPRLFASARPSPRCHLTGSLYATYAGSTSCFLPTRCFHPTQLPCWSCPSVRSRRAVLLPVASHQKISHSAMPGARSRIGPETPGVLAGRLWPWGAGIWGENRKKRNPFVSSPTTVPVRGLAEEPTQ